MPIRELPEAPASLHILGPGMLLAALGVGLRRDVSVAAARHPLRAGYPLALLHRRHAPGSRHAGDGPLRDGHRREHLLRGGPSVAADNVVVLRHSHMVYIWPGHVALGAQAFESLTGISWYISGRSRADPHRRHNQLLEDRLQRRRGDLIYLDRRARDRLRDRRGAGGQPGVRVGYYHGSVRLRVLAGGSD